jgi:sugar lactone lactonase YvrE
MPPDGTTLAARPPNSVTPDGFALSPDGQYVVFVASEPAGKRRLWVQRLDSLAARMLEGTEDAEGVLVTGQPLDRSTAAS